MYTSFTHPPSPRVNLSKRGSIPCADCHAANAFLRKPYIREAKVVPDIGPKADYKIVMQEFFAPQVPAKTTTRVPEYDVPVVKTCTGCHAVGRGKYCRVYLKMAWAQFDESLMYSHFLSQDSGELPVSLWHHDVLPSLKKVETADDLKSLKFSKAVEEIAAWCAENDLN